MDALPTNLNGQNVRLVAFAIAFRATNKHVAQELHFDLFVAHAPAALAATGARVEGKCAGSQLLGGRFRGGGEEFANAVEDAQVPARDRGRFTSCYRPLASGTLELVDAPGGQWSTPPAFPSGAGGSEWDGFLGFRCAHTSRFRPF